MCRNAELTKTPAAEPPRYRRIGDALHVAVLASIAVYGVSICKLLTRDAETSGGGRESSLNIWNQVKARGQQQQHRWSSFDQHWTKDGFCMPHDEIPLLTTHERSAFLLIALSALGFCLINVSKDPLGKMENAKERVKWALVGAMGHAAGHIILAVTKRHGLLPNGEVSAMDEFRADDCNFVTYAKHIPGYLLFWIPLVKTYMYNVSKNYVAAFAFLIWMGATQMPLKFGFSYTLIVLFAGQSIDQLFLSKHQKGFEYMLWPIVTLIPNLFIAIMESMFCTRSNAFSTHGHLIFDGYMAFSYSAYYMGCWFWTSFGRKKSEKIL